MAVKHPATSNKKSFIKPLSGYRTDWMQFISHKFFCVFSHAAVLLCHMVGKFPQIFPTHMSFFSGICRAIPQTLVSLTPLNYAVQEEKNGNGSLFLAGDVHVWLLKVAAVAAAAVVVMEASILGCWTLVLGHGNSLSVRHISEIHQTSIHHFRSDCIWACVSLGEGQRVLFK